MEKIRLGIVGTGLIWRNTHRPVLDKLADRYSIRALCVVKEDELSYWKGEYPQARYYRDYQTLVEDPDIDAVLVATPISLNPIVSIAALKAGKNVFEEKPIAVTSAQAEEVLAAQNVYGKKVFMLEQLMYDPKILNLQKLVREQTLGRPVSYEMLTHFILDPEKDGEKSFSRTPWRMNPDFPLGAIFDGGAHDFAILTALFGSPDTVFAYGSKLRETMGEYDHVMSLLAYKNGIAGMHSHSAYLGCSNNYFNVRFAQGAVYVEDNGLTIERRTGEQEKITFPESNLHELMWNDLYDIYFGRKEPVFTSEQAADSVLIFDAITSSIRTGRSASI